MKLPSRVGLIVASVLALAACGSNASPTPISNVSPTPGVQQTREAAASAYAAATAAYKMGAVQAGAQCPGPEVTRENIRRLNMAACYYSYAAVGDQFTQSVVAIKFPSEMKADVNALITANTAQTNAFAALGKATSSTSPSAFAADLAAVNAAASPATTASAKVSSDLQLTPAPVFGPYPSIAL